MQDTQLYPFFISQNAVYFSRYVICYNYAQYNYYVQLGYFLDQINIRSSKEQRISGIETLAI